MIRHDVAIANYGALNRADIRAETRFGRGGGRHADVSTFLREGGGPACEEGHDEHVHEAGDPRAGAAPWGHGARVSDEGQGSATTRKPWGS